jgi:hypothetical protein
MDLARILVIGLLILIVASLGNALFHLATGKGDSRKMLRALTFRVGLSIGLFLLLMLAWRLGYIAPHGVPPR